MTDNSPNPTSTPATEPRSATYRQVIERLRGESGLPPWEPIIHPLSEAESERRIKASKARVDASPLYSKPKTTP